MSDQRTPHDQLVARLLERHEITTASQTLAVHPDDDTLALFAEGHLSPSQQRELVDHLVNCADCRTKAALLLTASDEAEYVEPARPTIPMVAVQRRWPLQMLALAAGLLICVGGYLLFSSQGTQLAENDVYVQASELLAQGQFDRAAAEIDAARAGGVSSPRLDNLASQALRKIPGTIALAAAGKLSDLGIGIGGIVAREPAATATDADVQRAKELLDAASSTELAAALNRGHLLLALNHADQALAQFEQLAAAHPSEPLAWLGKGSAHFLLHDYSAAAEAYRRSISLEPKQLSARMNLAMTLEELDDLSGARAEWELVLAADDGQLREDERRQINKQLEALRAAAP